MGKKKQPDFQKTKLRVGRTLPKGRNVTDTSFKSKKITVPSQKIEKAVNLEDQLKLVGHHNPKTQILTLQWVSHYIQANFSIEHLPLILEKAERATLDVDAGVRQAAIKLLDATLSLSSSLQVEGHIRSIICNLRCGMTHGDIKVRKDALHFLDVLLRNHPKLLSSYHSLLSVILDMISSRYASKSHRKKRRTLPAVYDGDIKSQVWRMDVLKRFESLLNIIVASFSSKNEDKEDGRTLYWSALKPLSLELIPGRDLEPIEYDLSKDLNFLSSNVDSQVWTSDMLKILIDEITPVLMDVFAEEVSEFISQIPDPWVKSGGVVSVSSSLENCFLPPEVAGNVNVITQIFCSLGKWVQILSKTDRCK
ncbi:testis-expressed protein 10 homolog [Uloborus diversus]|uniref:testis-expressed protein 10 homolog n=1 Tax=Uloborus diversus TaxID=327109 RepID=UPI00240A2B68|nr:testis-expressed protein 10 homolog [Uloborus diversus]